MMIVLYQDQNGNYIIIISTMLSYIFRLCSCTLIIFVPAQAPYYYIPFFLENLAHSIQLWTLHTPS